MIKTIKVLVASFFILLSTTIYAAPGDYPIGPDPDKTPGVLCENGSSYRYPEKIRYCNRNVEKSLKDRLIREYDREFGYKIGRMDRQQFKIDHLIPLCMGGSNDEKNLWPQHQTVYEITDPFEQKLCELMAAGKLKQAQAVEIILDLKSHLEEADRYEEVIRQIESRGPGKGRM